VRALRFLKFFSLIRADANKDTIIYMKTPDLAEQARTLQIQYWTPNTSEKERLTADGIDRLDWEKSFRLLHLACLDLISTGSGKDELASDDTEGRDAPEGKDRDLIAQLLKHLRSAASPYKERHAAVWQNKAGESETREPDLQGTFRNASLTHLGSLEVVRLDSQQRPAEIWFAPLDELRGVVFARPAVFGLGKLFFDSQRPDEIVLIPLLYGISWRTPNPFDQDGTVTRFISHINADDGKGTLSIGVGHQDFVIDQSERQSLIGLGSVGELMLSLSMTDPKFEEKCRARGLEPAEVRRSMT
jgi:hypothetical protein